MNHLKKEFIKLCIDNNVLKFGRFQLKSGRISPYFFNAGLFYQGNSIKQLGELYAQVIINNKLDLEHLFGPAYKGLPLATSTAIALADKGYNITVTFNRKEIKEHGEGGNLIGAPLSGKTAIIDDVITAGTAFREAQSLIEKHNGNLTTLIIALDRCEKGNTDNSAINEIEKQGIKVYSIIKVHDLMHFLEENNKGETLKELNEYHEKYGIN